MGCFMGIRRISPFSDKAPTEASAYRTSHYHSITASIIRRGISPHHEIEKEEKHEERKRPMRLVQHTRTLVATGSKIYNWESKTGWSYSFQRSFRRPF